MTFFFHQQSLDFVLDEVNLKKMKSKSMSEIRILTSSLFISVFSIHFFLKYLFLFCAYMYVPTYMSVYYLCACTLRINKSVEPLGARAIGRRALPDLGTKKYIWVLGSSSKCF